MDSRKYKRLNIIETEEFFSRHQHKKLDDRSYENISFRPQIPIQTEIGMKTSKHLILMTSHVDVQIA